MSKIYTSATQLIGHTPLLKVTNYSKDQNIEGYLPCHLTEVLP